MHVENKQSKKLKVIKKNICIEKEKNLITSRNSGLTSSGNSSAGFNNI
jgi:hypothetical protein